MSQYQFYSRQNGYPNGTLVKYYTSPSIIDYSNESNIFINKSSKEILDSIHLIKNDILRTTLNKLASTYINWYYYPIYTIITDTRIYI